MMEVASKANLAQKEQASKQALKASEETKKDIEKEQKIIKEEEERISKMKTEAIESLTTMEKLALENSNLMNEESLKMAERELGKVTDLFGRILLFWEQFSAKLTTLTRSHDAIETYIEFITDDDLAEEIDESVTTVKKVWTSFGNMCTNYVDKSVEQLPELYAFMATPVDQMSIEACTKRKQELLESQRAEIKEIEEKFIKL
ncbi:uncharacterized protein LOC132745630 [Ruditapes philippinarum]|uniref:uncharacterized protein LOC132745630 n=1 Tax=Ruditapes philippinarum TaxID=129788 RepID=UPI00295C0F99|nr:uncharacterized protein LOC132745630 [Ruditapes philippinarum]